MDPNSILSTHFHRLSNVASAQIEKSMCVYARDSVERAPMLPARALWAANGAGANPSLDAWSGLRSIEKCSLSQPVGGLGYFFFVRDFALGASWR